MAVTLTQRSLFSTGTYTLEYNGVRIQEQGLNKQVEGFITFENIPSSPYFQRVFRRDAIIACMFFGVTALIFIFAQISAIDTFPQPRGIIITLVMIGLPAALLWFSRLEYTGFGLPGGGIVFEATKPSRAAVASFMEQLHAAKVAYLRDVYLTHASEISPADELRRLMWLKDMGALTPAEFDEQKQKLDRSGATSAKLGFHPER